MVIGRSEGLGPFAWWRGSGARRAAWIVVTAGFAEIDAGVAYALAKLIA